MSTEEISDSAKETAGANYIKVDSLRPRMRNAVMTHIFALCSEHGEHI